MSDMQETRPGAPGTTEGETGDTESDPTAPSVEGRDAGGDQEAPSPS